MSTAGGVRFTPKGLMNRVAPLLATVATTMRQLYYANYLHFRRKRQLSLTVANTSVGVNPACVQLYVRAPKNPFRDFFYYSYQPTLMRVEKILGIGMDF